MALTKVTHDVLEGRYTSAEAVQSATTVTLDTSLHNVFTWTLGHDVQIKFTNVKIGTTSTIIVTGAATDYTITLPTADGINGASSTFNKVSGTLDSSNNTKNLIEFKFISTSECWYQISQIAT